MAHSCVFGTAKNIARLQWTPRQTITMECLRTLADSRSTRNAPLLGLPNQPYVGLTHATTLRLTRVLGSVEDKNLTGDSFGSDQIRVLRHIACPVDFSRVVDTLDDLKAWLRRKTMPAKLATFIVVVASVKYIGGAAAVTLWKLDSSNLEVVLRLTGRMSPYEHAVDGVWLICWST